MLDTPQEVIDRARSLWYVSSNQYTDTLALEDYNLYRKKIANEIMQKVNEWFFTSTITTPTVVWQNKYSLTDTVNNIKINKIDSVYIDGEKATKIDGTGISEENKENLSSSYYVKNDYIYIYPSPTEIVNIKMEAAITPWTLAIADTDEDMPEEARELISLWMIVDIYKRRGLLNEASFAFTAFNNEMGDLIASLTDRVSSPETYTVPNLDYYA